MENNLGMLLARMAETLERAYAYLCCFSEHFQMQHTSSLTLLGQTLKTRSSKGNVIKLGGLTCSGYGT